MTKLLFFVNCIVGGFVLIHRVLCHRTVSVFQIPALQVFLGSSVVDGHPVAIKMVNKDRPDIPWQDYAGYLKNEVLNIHIAT